MFVRMGIVMIVLLAGLMHLNIEVRCFAVKFKSQHTGTGNLRDKVEMEDACMTCIGLHFLHIFPDFEHSFNML